MSRQPFFSVIRTHLFRRRRKKKADRIGPNLRLVLTKFIQVHAALETLWTLILLASGPSDETFGNSRKLPVVGAVF
jgi:hypothetical protein